MSASEKVHPSQEQPKNDEVINPISYEHQERIRKTIEEKSSAVEQDDRPSIEDITQLAIDTAPSQADAKSHETIPAQKRQLITRHQRAIAFDKQMSSVQQEMNPSERRFSKIIHKKSIEKTSDALGASIARPNALLAGSISAFVLVTVLYLIAKHYGYRLSGFETIAAFILGWVIGMIYDYVKLLISGNRQR
ncbi:MAG: hypothetical protein EOP04_28955 [Proteobacteria bacterium]|nr:MAG: hypothetical protein EOP04_28955 [Pseudomonadota bacterium]